MKQSLFILCVLFLYSSHLLAQPKHEFRAVWVATVVNIDWPSAKGLSTAKQKAEVVEILDMHKDLGMNAIILQVRQALMHFTNRN